MQCVSLSGVMCVSVVCNICVSGRVSDVQIHIYHYILARSLSQSLSLSLSVSQTQTHAHSLTHSLTQTLARTQVTTEIGMLSFRGMSDAHVRPSLALHAKVMCRMLACVCVCVWMYGCLDA